MTDKAIAVAEKITTMAEDVLSGLDLTIRKWPAEFQAIIWSAVADIASRRAEQAQRKHPR